jgi:hypothetical protein
MNAFLISVGTLSGLVVIAHVARMVAEPRMAGEPWFWIMTAIAAALSGWSWYLFGTLRRSK